MSKYPKTPELDKINSVNEQTQAAGAFLDWLTQNGVTLCIYREFDEDDEDETIDGYYPVHMPILELLAEWQGIDQVKAEIERMALLDWIREQQELK